jgi:hypothetical protein
LIQSFEISKRMSSSSASRILNFSKAAEEDGCNSGDEEDYYFVNVDSSKEAGIDATSESNSVNQTPTSISSGEELFYSPSLSPASAPPSNMNTPQIMQTPVKHNMNMDMSASKSNTKGGISSALRQVAARDSFSKKSNSSSNLTKQEQKVMNERTDTKWMSMLNNWRFTLMFRSGSFRRRLRRGVPSHLRPMTWHRIADIDTLKHRYPNPSKYDKSKISKQCRDDIEKDIDRTFPEHELFTREYEGGKGQDSLRNVLLWYAAHDPETQYCQGMSFICGLLLTYFTQEEAFYCFKHCLSTMSLRDMFLPGLVDLQKKLYVFTQLGWAYDEELWDHMIDNGVKPMMYATEWFMTLFCRGFNFELCTRVVEIFMFEGFKIAYRVALTILHSMKDELMDAGFEEMLAIIRVRSKEIDANQIMIDAFTWKFRSNEIEKYEKVYDKLEPHQRM